MVSDLCRPRSNRGDWLYTTQLKEVSDGNPLWSVTPADLIATMTLLDRDGVQAFRAIYQNGADPSGTLSFFDDSYMDVIIPAAKMATLTNELYNVHLKFQTEGRTIEFVLGRLPVIEGA